MRERKIAEKSLKISRVSFKNSHKFPFHLEDLLLLVYISLHSWCRFSLFSFSKFPKIKFYTLMTRQSFISHKHSFLKIIIIIIIIVYEGVKINSMSKYGGKFNLTQKNRMISLTQKNISNFTHLPQWSCWRHFLFSQDFLWLKHSWWCSLARLEVELERESKQLQNGLKNKLRIPVR